MKKRVLIDLVHLLEKLCPALLIHTNSQTNHVLPISLLMDGYEYHNTHENWLLLLRRRSRSEAQTWAGSSSDSQTQDPKFLSCTLWNLSVPSTFSIKDAGTFQSSCSSFSADGRASRRRAPAVSYVTLFVGKMNWNVCSGAPEIASPSVSVSAFKTPARTCPPAPPHISPLQPDLLFIPPIDS